MARNASGEIVLDKMAQLYKARLETEQGFSQNLAQQCEDLEMQIRQHGEIAKKLEDKIKELMGEKEGIKTIKELVGFTEEDEARLQAMQASESKAPEVPEAEIIEPTKKNKPH